jgi:DNA-binding transcriptional MerR regulator
VTHQHLSPADAARHLNVSTKALRLYEDRGLITPIRSAAGWRTYGPKEMARASEVISLRALGLSLGQIGRILNGDERDLEPALAAHQALLEQRTQQIEGAIARIRRMRTDIAAGNRIASSRFAHLDADLKREPVRPAARFKLPWPWDGEWFELNDIRALTYIVGPLGSGKTRFAKRLAETLPDAVFIGLDRLSDDGGKANARLDADPALRSRVDLAIAWLVDEGATACEALIALLAALETDGPRYFVVDMLEQGLDGPTQEALVSYLRSRSGTARPIFALTRSSVILDLTALPNDEAVIFCPANHSPPMLVPPYPGAPGYEGVATCLATPEVRARTAGVIAWRPPAAQ